MRGILGLGLLMQVAAGLSAGVQFRTELEFTYQTNGILELRRIDISDRLPVIEVGDDAAWNWGAVSEGIEMGMRFTKSAGVPGEPMELEILARNVSGQSTYFAVWGSPIDHFKITVTDDQNRSVPELRDSVYSTETHLQKRLNRRMTNPKPYPLPPGMQHIHVLKLDEFFDLSRPGKYFVTAVHGVPRLDGSGYSEVNSGVATAAFPGNTNRIVHPIFPPAEATANRGPNKIGEARGDNASVGPARADSTSSDEAKPPGQSGTRRGLFIMLACLFAGTLVFMFRPRSEVPKKKADP